MTVNVNDPTASGMILTFDDEFNSNSTSSDNAASGTQWSNHLWYDAANPGAISVANGVLSLASGGELSSVDFAGNGFSQTYGYFEIDMKVPAGVGTWPAFWLMSQQHVVNGANPASEIDVMEGQGNQPNGYYTTLHSNTGSVSDQVNPMPNFTGNVSATPLSAGYHSFGVLWSPDSNIITYYLDGNPVATSTEYSTTNYSPDMILIDNWLGDIGWGGNTPVAGQSYGPLQIDNVRVYQFAGQGGTAIAPQTVSAAAGQADAAMLADADGGTGAGDPTAQAPTLSVANASGTAGSAIALNITAAQASSSLASADLTVTVSNLGGATLNHGTLANGVYTLHASDLSGLTVTPAGGFTGTLALNVTATDTEPSSSTTASSAAETLDVTIGSGAVLSSPGGGASPSANDTVVTGATGSIVTAAHNTFAINAAGQITENGTAIAATHGVTELAYVNATLYQEATAQNLWFSLNEATSAWTLTSNPLPTSSPNDTVVIGTSGNILTAANNTFAINAAGQITENGTAIAATHGVTELAYVNNTLYQEATAQNLWFSINEATSAWTLTSDPLPAAPVDPLAAAPSLSVTNVSGTEGTAIALNITATQAASDLAAADLSVSVSNLNGATLNHGTLSNGVYTLHAADLSGLTVTPAAGFTGMLAINVTATDTEPSSNTTASSAADALDVTVTAPALSPLASAVIAAISALPQPDLLHLTVEAATGPSQTITGTGPDALLIGGGAWDKLNAGTGFTVLAAGSGSETLTGGSGTDDFLAGAGADRMVAGSGANYMKAGAGADTFVVRTGASGNIDLYGFNPALDKFEVHTSNATAASLIHGATSDAAGDAVLHYGAHALVLHGITTAQLNADWFTIIH